jgi:hypothetical protein
VIKPPQLYYYRKTLWIGLLTVVPLGAQAPPPVWAGYGHDAQHTAVSGVASRPLNQIRWQTPVDLMPVITGNDIYIHFGSPLITAGNTILIPVKTGSTGGFRIDARDEITGALLYSLATDYSAPASSWIPPYGPVVTPQNRVYWAGTGGSLYYRDQPDAATGPTGQLWFYGLANYLPNAAQANASLKISTPLVTDSIGDIFFGFVVLGPLNLPIQSGIARINPNGLGSFITAQNAAGGDPSITEVPLNCAPALSNDEQTLYFAVSSGGFGSGYLASVSATTLAPIAHTFLKDPNTGNDATLPDIATASPMVGPDGDVYYGVLDNPIGSNNDRGWMLHFDSSLTQLKTPGAFGWDDTASVVAANLVPSYHGSSSYLILTKYNNYAGIGTGNGMNKLAVLDPNATESDPVTGKTVMNEVLTVLGPNHDPAYPNLPAAVYEWCINSAAVDPLSKSALVNSEDGNLYRWDFTTNTLSQQIRLTSGIGEAYTPTLIGADGTVYAINDATLFAVGAEPVHREPSRR